MTICISASPRVMVSGHFDPFHDMHLDYIEQAVAFGGELVCVISSDKQLLMKKGIVNIPEQGRKRIVDLILTGLGVAHDVLINTFDAETTLVAEALRYVKPDIFLRGGDKSPSDMPDDEVQACMEYHIDIRYAQFKINRHGSRMKA